jgi:hypothetical protein
VGQANETVRGGSWNNNQQNARVAVRNRNDPDNSNNNIGFRAVSHDFRLLTGIALGGNRLRPRLATCLCRQKDGVVCSRLCLNRVQADIKRPYCLA